MKNKKVYLDLHVLQTVPPSNMNRDDTGSPKTAQYGGVKRARVSSQSWKKAMRDYFNEHQDNRGYRTLKLIELLAKEIVHQDFSISMDEAFELAEQNLKIIQKNSPKNKDNKKVKEDKLSFKFEDKKLKALYFVSGAQIKCIARCILDNRKENSSPTSDELKEILQQKLSLDIALFGRMLADDPTLNEDASAQVAHAISTHGVQTEYDFFTSLDDLSEEGQSGAGMLGTIEFNSSTLYRYANVAIHELVNQIQDEEMLLDCIKTFIEAFANSLPTGKVNTFANQTVPSLIHLAIRTDRPINLVTAFEHPVQSKKGYMEESILKLDKEIEKTLKFTSKASYSSHVNATDSEVVHLGVTKDSLPEAINELTEVIKEHIQSL